MAARTKMTPFARFLLFLIILLPAAYFGAAYYRGEDPMAGLKNTFGQEAKDGSSTNTSSSSGTYDPQDRVRQLEKENTALKKEIETLKAKLEQVGSNSNSSESWGD